MGFNEKELNVFLGTRECQRELNFGERVVMSSGKLLPEKTFFALNGSHVYVYIFEGKEDFSPSHCLLYRMYSKERVARNGLRL